MGLAHDLGKYSAAFQSYISGHGTSPDHATAGAQVLMHMAAGAGPYERVAAQLAAFAVAGHHSGLPDRGSIDEPGTLEHRLIKPIEPLDPCWRDELPLALSGCFGPRSLQPSTGEEAFQLAFLGRMIFSALVDADFIDTETFYAEHKKRRPDRSWPALIDILPGLIGRFDAEMARKAADAKPGRVNALRTEILAVVRAKAKLPRGVYTLDVPTGGGKTLASLGFALDHALTHGMRRILVAIPFTSIIEQTAKVFGEVLGEGVVLEHHSGIEQEERASASEGERQASDKLRLAMENWAAPVVVTTNVQLLESLFADRTSRCRKLHALADAVIILDEAQTIPLPVLRPAIAALRELALNYGATIVLCTATQPALAAPEGEGTDGFMGGFAPRPVELAPDPAALHAAFRRVQLDVRTTPMTDAELVDELAGSPQGLIIVNTRGHALALHRAAAAAGLEGLMHLSTRQIAADRGPALETIRALLKDEAPCRVIATSLVEAGVDLDFPHVWRAEAGLDQIAQAAGRCNREGRRLVEGSVVTVFRAAEHRTPREIQALVNAMRSTRESHADLFSPEAMRRYFREVYWARGPKELDRHDVLGAFKISGGQLSFAYRTVGERFRLIESGMEPVIVPIHQAAIEAVAGVAGGWLPAGAAAQRLQRHIVLVPPKARQRLLANGRAKFVDKERQFVVLTDMTLYTPEIGLLWGDADYLSIESLFA